MDSAQPPPNAVPLTRAQLSPAVADSAAKAKNKAKQLGKSIKKFFKDNKDDSGRKLGFSLSDKLVVAHEATETMGPCVAQFQVTKLRTWRTGYQRLLVLYDEDFATFDGTTETNRWRYQMLTEWAVITEEQNTILLNVGDKLKFTAHEASGSRLMMALLEQQDRSGQANTSQHSLWNSVQRYTRHGTTRPVRLVAKTFGLVELDASNNKELQTYRYDRIIGVSLVSDNGLGIVLHLVSSPKYPRSRVYLMTGNGRSELVGVLQVQAEVLGLPLKMQASSTLSQLLERRRAWKLYPTQSWAVTKTTPRHEHAVQRNLYIFDHVVEHDGAGVVSARPLTSLVSLVRTDSNIILQFRDATRTYNSGRADALLVSLLDAAQSVGNKRVSVVCHDPRPYRLSWEIDDDAGKGMFAAVPIAHICLKLVHCSSTQAYAFLSKQYEANNVVSIIEECRHVLRCCREFNASVPPTGEGLPNTEKDKIVFGALGALWGLVSGLLVSEESVTSRARFEAEIMASELLQTVYRLSQTMTGYKSSVELTTLQECIPLLFRITDNFCKYWGLNVLLVLVSALRPTREEEIEYTNKRVIFTTGGPALIAGLVAGLLEPSVKVNEQGRKVVSDLMLMVSSDILQSLLCSNHDTTSPESFQALIEALGREYRALLGTLRSPTPFVIENTALLLHLLSTHAPQTALAIRDAALSSAVLLKHFYMAIFSPLEGQRFLSRYLCGLWMSGPPSCDEKRLLKRMVPHGFLAYLNMPTLSKAEEGQLDRLERDAVEVNMEKRLDESGAAAATNTDRLRRRMDLANQTFSSKSKSENFRIFFHVLTQDHSLADLIWSQQTRRELRIALEGEIQYIERESEAMGLNAIAWNHQQFRVRYPSLDNEVRVGDVYMRLWLQAGDGFIRSWEEPLRLFEHLFRRFLCEIDRNTAVSIRKDDVNTIFVSDSICHRSQSCAFAAWSDYMLFTPKRLVPSLMLWCL